MPSYLNDDNDKEQKNKPSSRTIALDKLEMRDEELRTTRRPKKSSKIAGRKQQNVFVRFATAAFPQAEDPMGEKIRKSFLLVAVAVLAGALIFLGYQIFDMGKGEDLNTSLAEIVGAPFDIGVTSYSVPQYIENPSPIIATTSGDEEPPFPTLTPVKNVPLKVNFDTLIEQNPDTRAWIKIQDTMVNNVVVQSDNNDYYLSHNFNGEPSVSGTICSSYLNTWDGSDDNTILFGHNMKNGSFFAYVIHYYPDDASRDPLYFYKVHPTVMMATPDGGCATYKIFAGILVNTESKHGSVFQYVDKTKFTDVNDFNNFIIEVMDRSYFFTDVDIKYGDELLTLSTCHWPYGQAVDTRWVVFARKVRPGESEEVDVSKAYRNYQVRYFDYAYRINSSLPRWVGSVWDKSKLLSY